MVTLALALLKRFSSMRESTLDKNLLTNSWSILGWIFERQNLAINGCVLKIPYASTPKDNRHKHKNKDTTFDSGTLEVFWGGCFYLFLDVRLEVLKSGTSFVSDRTLLEKDSQAVISFSQNMILSQNKNICSFQISCKFPNFKISELR